MTGQRGAPEPSVTVETPSETVSGRVVRLSGELDPTRLGAAIRGADVDSISVECADPQEVHAHLGVIEPDISIRRETALAAAARSRDVTAPQADELRSVRQERDELTIPEADPDAATARERLAGTQSTIASLRERVAEIRGQIKAGRQAGRDVSDLQERLVEVTRELSEWETERAAAREALEQAE